VNVHVDLQLTEPIYHHNILDSNGASKSTPIIVYDRSLRNLPAKFCGDEWRSTFSCGPLRSSDATTFKLVHRYPVSTSVSTDPFDATPPPLEICPILYGKFRKPMEMLILESIIVSNVELNDGYSIITVSFCLTKGDHDD